MPPSPVTPTSRTRCCLACPGGENVTPKSSVSQNSPSYGSMGRTLGYRSLDAVRSVRGSLRGRRTLNTATNAIPATSSSSCSSSPAGSATKQRWYDSIRSRTSQIPMPSPASSSPTLKRRLFKTDEILPKLDLPGLDSSAGGGLRRTTTFRACSEKVIQDIGKKYEGTRYGFTPEANANNDVFMMATERMRLKRPDTKTEDSSQEPESSLAVKSDVQKCDVHYPLIPSAPSRTEHFEDTAAALSNYCLNNMLCGNPDYSNVVLWTLHTSVTSPSKVQQSFTVLPNYLKPDRNALGTTYQWAVIVFRSDPAPSRVPVAVRQHESLLQAAVAKIVNMGYHIDVWTKSDNYCWREAKLQALGTRDCQGPDQSLREKYQAMVSHGIPGFSIHEIQTIDDVLRIREPASDSEDSETVCSEFVQQTKPETEDHLGCRSDYDSEFGGFLEHQEESILPAGSETQFQLHDDSHMSGVSEDLDMATRLGGKTFA